MQKGNNIKFRPGEPVYYAVSLTKLADKVDQVWPDSTRAEFNSVQLEVLDLVSGLVLAGTRQSCLQAWEQLREDHPHERW